MVTFTSHAGEHRIANGCISMVSEHVASYKPNKRSFPCSISHSAATVGHVPSTTHSQIVSSQASLYMLTHCNRHRNRRCIPKSPITPAHSTLCHPHATHAAHQPAPAVRGVRTPAGYPTEMPLPPVPKPSPLPPIAPGKYPPASAAETRRPSTPAGGRCTVTKPP